MMHIGPDVEGEKVAIPVSHKQIGRLHRGVGAYFTSDDMSDSHLVIVHHRSKVICWE